MDSFLAAQPLVTRLRRSPKLVHVSQAKYKRVLLKLSGEALLGDRKFGISPEYVRYLAGEIRKVYHLKVTAIPTHKVCVRKPYPTRVFVTQEAKRRAILEEIERLADKG